MKSMTNNKLLMYLFVLCDREWAPLAAPSIASRTPTTTHAELPWHRRCLAGWRFYLPEPRPKARMRFMGSARTTTSTISPDGRSLGQRWLSSRRSRPKRTSPPRPYSEILFLPVHNAAQEKWTGPKLGADNPQAPAITGFDRVANLDQMPAELARILGNGPASIYLDLPASGETSPRPVRWNGCVAPIRFLCGPLRLM